MGDIDSSILFTKEYFLQDNICRFCWTKDAMIDCTLKSPLFFKVEYCLNIDLSQDDSIYFPKKACQNCFTKIDKFHDFKTFCLNANKQLTEIVYNNLVISTTNVDKTPEEIKLEKVENTAYDFKKDSSFDSQQSSDSNLENIVDSLNDDSSFIKQEKKAKRFDALQYSFAQPKPKVANKSVKNLNKTKSVNPTQSGRSSGQNSDKDTFLKQKSESQGIEKDSKYGCFICKQIFTNKSNWMAHIKEHAPNIKISEVNISELITQTSTNAVVKKNIRSPTYCKSCLEEFHDEDNFIKHRNDAHGIEKDGRYRCFGCGKLFVHRVSRLSHESQKCLELEHGYKCSLCDRYLPSRGVYEKHMKNHRLNKTVNLPEDIFKCNKCGEQFPNKRGLVLHVKEYGHNKRNSDENPSDCQSMKRRNNSATYCRKCTEEFYSKEAFIKHKSEAHGIEKDGKYRCFGCSKLFTLRESCLTHEAKICPQLVDGYKCSLCNTFAQTRSTYEKHMTNHRQNRIIQVTNQHIFKCSKCKEKFTKKSEWVAHVKSHSNMKEFICETCGKAFSNRTLLNMHQTMHTGERKYHCAHCGFRCTQKQNLISHIRTHTKERPFQCDMCPARWTTQSSLQRHRRSHFGIKLHKCHYDNCDKKFAYPVSLKEHIAINHEGTASYPCTFCGQVYLRKGHLRKHWKKKHPEQATFMIQQTPGRRPNYEKGLP